MKILIPNTFVAERKYIVDILFDEFLGLQYSVEIFSGKDYELQFENNLKIIIKDFFWSNIDEKYGYLHQKYIPTSVEYYTNELCPEANMPIIYGKPQIDISEKLIICYVDIFASSFFMLTRWEELVCQQKDKYQRFPDTNSLSQKFSFYNRPIVNEYTELLWNLLQKVGVIQQRRIHKYEVIPTHDIDYLFKFNNLFNLFRAIAGDIIKLKSFKRAWKTILDYFKIKHKKKLDPFDTFDYLMDISEQYNLKSHFYFIPGKIDENNIHYNILNKKTIDIIKHILQREHIVGMHASFCSYNNKEQMKKEKERLQKIIENIEESRQDYLRFENPTTWQILNDIGIKIDSTIGFANTNGFRAGTCYTYSVFNVIKQQKLQIKEIPLIFMEQAGIRSNTSVEHFLIQILQLKEKVKRYNGKFVILWHNNNITNPYFEQYTSVYQNIFD